MNILLSYYSSKKTKRIYIFLLYVIRILYSFSFFLCYIDITFFILFFLFFFSKSQLNMVI